MILPVKSEIIRNIESNLPLEILKDNIWIAYYFKEQPNGKITKPPMSSKGYTVKENAKGFKFEEVCKDGYPGILLTKDNEYVAFDIDDDLAKNGTRKFSLELLSLEFQEFLLKYPSYTELSPSGCGLRVIVRCKNKKEILTDSGRLILDKNMCIGGELFIHSGYVTITGNCVSNPRKLANISLPDILQWSSKREDVPAKLDNDRNLNVLRVFGLKAFADTLDMCKLDQSDKVKRAYKSIIGTDYVHYDYWLKILSSSHDYAIKTGKMNEVTEMILHWSMNDKTAYQSKDDVLSHWMSLGNKENPISYKTLMKFNKLLKFDWPKPVIKKGFSTGKPLINENKNFKYLLNYYNIRFALETLTNQFYITADDAVMNEFFPLSEDKKDFFGMRGPYTKDEMLSKMWGFAQDNGYDNATISTIGPLFRTAFYDVCDRINIFEKWLTTAAEDIPFDLREPGTEIDKSNLDFLMSCIDFQSSQNMELAYKYMETFFFEMVMPIYNARQIHAERSFVLILTGLENTRKSSFFRMLFPTQLLKSLLYTSNNKLGDTKALRDFKNVMTRRALIVIDEFDHFYDPKNDSLFKSLVTCSSAPFVPIYQTEPVDLPRMAVLAGTTNEVLLPYKQDSNRRFAMLRVNYIDTDKMQKINWHHFYSSFVKRGSEAMMKGLYPWKPNQDLIQLQYTENEINRAKTNLEQMLLEIYDFDMNTHKSIIDFKTIKGVQTDKRLLTYKQIEASLKQRFPSSPINIAELKRLLERLCGRYTRTTNLKIALPGHDSFLYNGIAKQGQWTRYVMPPKLLDTSDVF
jgi:hypothetical protein